MWGSSRPSGPRAQGGEGAELGGRQPGCKAGLGVPAGWCWAVKARSGAAAGPGALVSGVEASGREWEPLAESLGWVGG